MTQNNDNLTETENDAAAGGESETRTQMNAEIAAVVSSVLAQELPKMLGQIEMRPPSVTPIEAERGALPPPSLITKEALQKMTPDEIKRLDWAEVRRVLSAR